MSRFVGFIFNPVNLDTELKSAWGKILDQQYLKERAIDPIMRHVSIAQSLLEELCDRADYGMVAKKSKKKLTELEPFLLTKPNPRKLPVPNETITNSIKALRVPKTMYADPLIQKELEKLKLKNKEKTRTLIQSADETQFSVALRKKSDKLEKLKTQLQNEEYLKLEKAKVSYRGAKTSQVPNWTKTLTQSIPVKLTTAAILREDALIRKKKQEEMDAVQQVEMSLQSSSIEDKHDELKAKEEEERILQLGKRRLEIQLMHEDVFYARQEKTKENREKVVEALAQKEEIKVIAEASKKEQDEINAKKIEIVHEIKHGIVKSRQKVLGEKVKRASLISKEVSEALEKAKKESEEERQRKAELIQQIRLLEKAVPSVGTLVKDVDLTETSGMGLLGEMSILELQERLYIAKRRERDEQERKREEIGTLKSQKVNLISQKMQDIDRERNSRKNTRMSKATPKRAVSTQSLYSESAKTLIDSHPMIRALQAKLEAKKSGIPE